MRTHQVRSAAATAAKGVLLNRGPGRRAILRKAFFDIAGTVTPSVAVEHDGVWYYVNTDDRLVGRETFARSPYDADTMADAVAVLEHHGHAVRGRTFVDVGANIGTTTIAALTRFGASDVLAVEPEPRNVRLLRCNLIANDLEHRARVVQAAASATAGTAALHRTAGNSGDNRVRLDAPGDGSAIDVPLRRLDDLLSEHEIDLEQIGVVWMDCQGHEAHVLAGAPRLLESDVPVLVEYWPEGLREAGGTDMLHALIADHYDVVIDVRDVAGGAGRPLPARDVHTLEARYPEPAFTDLVLLKERRRPGGR